MIRGQRFALAAALVWMLATPAQSASYVQIGFSGFVDYDRYDNYTGLLVGHFQDAITGLVTLDVDQGPEQFFYTPDFNRVAYSGNSFSLTAFDHGPFVEVQASFAPPQPAALGIRAELAPLSSSFTSYIELGRSGLQPRSGKLTDLFLRESTLPFDEEPGVRLALSTTQLPLPEPASWIMMIGGFGMIGAVLRGKPGGQKLARTATRKSLPDSGA